MVTSVGRAMAMSAVATIAGMTGAAIWRGDDRGSRYGSRDSFGRDDGRGPGYGQRSRNPMAGMSIEEQKRAVKNEREAQKRAIKRGQIFN